MAGYTSLLPSYRPIGTTTLPSTPYSRIQADGTPRYQGYGADVAGVAKPVKKKLPTAGATPQTGSTAMYGSAGSGATQFSVPTPAGTRATPTSGYSNGLPGDIPQQQTSYTPYGDNSQSNTTVPNGGGVTNSTQAPADLSSLLGSLFGTGSLINQHPSANPQPGEMYGTPGAYQTIPTAQQSQQGVTNPKPAPIPGFDWVENQSTSGANSGGGQPGGYHLVVRPPTGYTKPPVGMTNANYISNYALQDPFNPGQVISGNFYGPQRTNGYGTLANAANQRPWQAGMNSNPYGFVPYQGGNPDLWSYPNVVGLR